MKILFVLVAFVALVAVIQASKHKLPPLDESFEHFKKEYNRSYQCEDLEKLRLKIFEDNVKLIKAHNKLYEEGKSTFSMGINNFADMLSSEVGGGFIPDAHKN